MHNLFSPIYRTVAAAKAILIAAADKAAAVQYLIEHGFSVVEANSILKGK